MTFSVVAAYGLAALLLIAGLGHFTAPDYFRSLVPAWLPAPHLIVAATGLTEVVLAALLAWPPTRAVAALITAGLITAYLTSHLDAARLLSARRSRDRVRWLERPAGVAARIIVNLVYVAWALAVALTA